MIKRERRRERGREGEKRERESNGIQVFNSADEGRLPGAGMVRGFFGITALRTVGTQIMTGGGEAVVAPASSTTVVRVSLNEPSDGRARR